MQEILPIATAPADPFTLPPAPSTQTPIELPLEATYPIHKNRFRKIVIPALLLTMLLVGVLASFFLSQLTQDIRQQASGGSPYPLCISTGQTECIAGKKYSCTIPGTQLFSPVMNNGVQETCVDEVSSPTEPTPSPTPVPSPFCFSTVDDCETFTLANCSELNHFPNSVSCLAARAKGGIRSCTLTEIDTCASAGGTCIFSPDLNRGTCQNITAGDECQTDIDCQQQSGSLVCQNNRCVQPPQAPPTISVQISTTDQPRLCYVTTDNCTRPTASHCQLYEGGYQDYSSCIAALNVCNPLIQNCSDLPAQVWVP